MILTKLHACLRMKIQSIKLYHRKEHPNHHKVFPASMLQWLQGIQKTTVVRRNLKIWICKPASPGLSLSLELLPRFLAANAFAGPKQSFGIQLTLLLLREKNPTGYNGMQESLRLHRIAQNASVHSWPLSLSVALLPLSCASPFLPLLPGNLHIAKGKSVQGHG